MARTHGRLATTIWDDVDFTAIDRPTQGMFAFLVSQPDLNQAGLIALRVARWAEMAKGLTDAEVERELAELEAARFIVVDRVKGEVLVRTFIRHDGVWKQPNVMLKAGEDARQIRSPKLRSALLSELARIPTEELSDEVRGKAERSPRAIVRGVIETLRRAFGPPREFPPDPGGEGSGNPSPDPSENPSSGVAGTHNARVPHSPTPFPYSDPSDRAAEPPQPEAITGEVLNAQTLVGEWIDNCRRRPPGNVVGQIAKQVGKLLDEDFAYADVRRALQAWQERGSLHPSVLPSILHGLDAPQTVPPQQRQSTTDARVAAGVELAQRYAAEEANIQLSIGEAS